MRYWEERAACATPGCRGLGHVKGARYTSHHSVSACPYSKQNLDNEDNLPDRLQDSEKFRDFKQTCEDDDDVSVVPVIVGKWLRAKGWVQRAGGKGLGAKLVTERLAEAKLGAKGWGQSW